MWQYMCGAVLTVLALVGLGTALDAYDSPPVTTYARTDVTPGLGERAAVALLKARGYAVTPPAVR